MFTLKGFKQLTITTALAGALALLTAGVAPAQSKPAETPAAPDVVESTPEKNATDETAANLERSLTSVIHAIKQTERELAALEKEVGQESNSSRLERLNAEIHELDLRHDKLRQDFVEIASGVDPAALEDRSDKSINLMADLRNLLHPLIREAQRLTSHAREDDQVRSEVARSTERLELIDKAIANTGRTEAAIHNPSLEKYLKAVRSNWEKRRQDAQTRLEIGQEALRRLEGERKSLAQSLNGIFDLFFRSRGRNLLVALIAAVIFFLLLGRLRNALITDDEHTPIGLPFSKRLANVMFNIFSFIGAGLLFMFVLYMYGDWVLLSLAALILVGVFWTSRQALPKFWNQMTILLNIGAVREGERVVINGVPWRVRTLNFYSELVNPLLTGGSLRLPVRDLHDLRSRKADPAEAWFPSKINDWVILEGGIRGQVLQQTPEYVELMIPGGSRRIFSTADFIAKSPMVISSGFRVETVFGIDYTHQAAATEEILKLIREGFTAELEKRGLASNVKNLFVEFKNAGASSLDFDIRLDFDGTLARDYRKLQNLPQEICVNLCNQHGWNIPFQQLTVHMAQT